MRAEWIVAPTPCHLTRHVGRTFDERARRVQTADLVLARRTRLDPADDVLLGRVSRGPPAFFEKITIGVAPPDLKGVATVSKENTPFSGDTLTYNAGTQVKFSVVSNVGTAPVVFKSRDTNGNDVSGNPLTITAQEAADRGRAAGAMGARRPFATPAPARLPDRCADAKNAVRTAEDGASYGGGATVVNVAVP
jgi:hypothetical protein